MSIEEIRKRWSKADSRDGDDIAHLLAAVARVEALAGGERETLFEGVFELADKYNINVTNSPDMRPGVPEAGDLCGDVLRLCQDAIRTALSGQEAEK